jgi:formate hydrogenlyase subunit 6/NADH:ubiquinone oxidoreductase subunit I
MIIVCKHLFKKPVTLEYPEQKIEPNSLFRGKPRVDGCIKCQTCRKVCPTGAITILETEFTFDLNKCIFCGNCAFYCPTKALQLTKDYELATIDKNKLKLVYPIGKNNSNMLKAERHKMEGGENERNT